MPEGWVYITVTSWFLAIKSSEFYLKSLRHVGETCWWLELWWFTLGSADEDWIFQVKFRVLFYIPPMVQTFWLEVKIVLCSFDISLMTDEPVCYYSIINSYVFSTE